MQKLLVQEGMELENSRNPASAIAFMDVKWTFLKMSLKGRLASKNIASVWNRASRITIIRQAYIVISTDYHASIWNLLNIN